jgi:hypothetical protein
MLWAVMSPCSVTCAVWCHYIPSIYCIARDMITGWHSCFGLACTAWLLVNISFNNYTWTLDPAGIVHSVKWAAVVDLRFTQWRLWWVLSCKVYAVQYVFWYQIHVKENFPQIIVFKKNLVPYPVLPYTERGRWTDLVDMLICARLLTITILTD